ncbi:hypothetical protein BDV28DRAFT_149727 [Aspergillus coremiiformis]|uniref:Uncharacterized protein n=1 Tax=Aspergillus coremiiformis TaxID=138285 RepID=A0A5N6Z3S5_9EURO|nr:hypothetical protein BDV28DRAFT_149727 [Aspergillus coremiiformis]
MPEQPGIERENSADQEGWGERQTYNQSPGKRCKISEKMKRFVTHPMVFLARIPPITRKTCRHYVGLISKVNEPLPVFTPGAARSYFLKSFTEAPKDDNPSPARPKRKRTSPIEAEKDTCLENLTDLVCRSWTPTVSKEESDRRAWA